MVLNVYKIQVAVKSILYQLPSAKGRASVLNISSKLNENISYLQGLFEDAMDFILRRLYINNIDAAILAIDGLVSKEQIAISILNPIMQTTVLQSNGKRAMSYVEQKVLGSVDQMQLHTMPEILDRLMNGFAVLLVDECSYALCIGIQGFDRRGVSEPEKEVMQRGSREGFIEALLINVSMIRRRMRTPDLKIERMIIGEESHTPITLCYLKTAVDPNILADVKSKLQKCSLKNLLAAGYLSGYLERPSIFESVGITERPDTLCGKLHEGRIGILVDGTPSALFVPYLFMENFQTIDDYASKPFFATFSRWLKYTAFFLAVFLPGIYVGTVSHNPELLPELLLRKVADSVASTPFPIVLEILLLYFMYEFLREAGTRVPKPLSSSIGIVGGLVIGETAVSAGLVGAPSLVVIALTVITGYTIPKLYEQMAILRLIFIVVGGIWGVWGILVGITVLLYDLCGKTSFSVPFMAPVAPFRLRSMRDIFVRSSWKKLSRHTVKIQNMPGTNRGGNKS